MNKHLKSFFVVILVGAVLVGAILWLFPPSQEQKSKSLSSVEKMEKEGVPNIQGQTIDGRDYDLSKSSAKLVIVNFWASWCAPCVEEIPSLVQLARHFKDQVEIVAISADEDAKDIRIFLKSFPELNDKNIFIVQDPGERYKELYQVNRLPESFIVKADKKLEKKVIGSITWFNDEAVEYINSLIQKQK